MLTPQNDAAGQDNVVRDDRGLCQPLDRQNLAAGGLKTRDGVAGVFNDRRHVMRIGVHDGLGVARVRLLWLKSGK